MQIGNSFDQCQTETVSRFGDCSASDDYADALAQSVHVVEQVCAHESTHAVIGAEIDQDVVNLAPPARIETVCRLVEDEEPRVGVPASVAGAIQVKSRSLIAKRT